MIPRRDFLKAVLGLSGAGYLRAQSEDGLANISSLVNVDGIHDPEIGFVVRNSAKVFLIRAVGAGLRSFGFTNALEDPVIEVSNGKETFTNDDWGDRDLTKAELDRIRAIEAMAGAFPLQSGSPDSMLILGPKEGLLYGDHTIRVRASTKNRRLRPTGIVLVEVYRLPLNNITF